MSKEKLEILIKQNEAGGIAVAGEVTGLQVIRTCLKAIIITIRKCEVQSKMNSENIRKERFDLINELIKILESFRDDAPISEAKK